VEREISTRRESVLGSSAWRHNFANLIKSRPFYFAEYITDGETKTDCQVCLFLFVVFLFLFKILDSILFLVWFGLVGLWKVKSPLLISHSFIWTFLLFRSTVGKEEYV